MYVLAGKTGEKLKATISKVDAAEIARINKSRRFDFNWNKLKQFDVYKLTATGINEPLGLMCLVERPEDYAIEIKLIAVSKENKGKDREYERIAGNLIAFACKESFIAGYEGYICLTPKTVLKNHYMIKYGLQSTKLHLVSEGRNSLNLVKEYYDESR